MDSKERLESHVPALPARVATSRLAPLDSPLLLTGAADPAGSLNIVRVTLRTVARHWWRMLALWILLTGGLVYLIHTKIKPRYESSSLLRVEPTPRGVFDPALHAAESFEPYLETQIQLITSPNVLTTALQDPRVAALPLVRESQDPEAELRGLLNVGVVQRSYLIRVALASPIQGEAATIVNAVVSAYLNAAGEWSYGMTKAQIESLEKYRSDLQRQADEKEEAWLDLAAKSNLDPLIAEPTRQGAMPGYTHGVLSGNRITLDEYKRVRQQLFDTELELVEAEALLQARRAEDRPAVDQGATQRLEGRIENLFRADPEVAGVIQQIEKVSQRVREAERVIRNPSDPSRIAALRQLSALRAKYQQLWERKKEELLARLQEQDATLERTGPSIRELEARVESLKVKKRSYEEKLSKIEIANKQEGAESVRVALVREDLASLKDMKEAVSRRLEDLRLSTKTEARISEVSRARPLGTLVKDSRKKYLAVAPIGVMCLLLGLFVLLEAKTGRIADIDELSKRAPIEVYAVPPLPGPRRSSRTHELQFQEFLQSLDHLRVALCGEETAAGSGRCLVITSAAGGEGKTTLSAQLAVCCAKSGISTLIIDADLRRAMLSRMFEEEQTPGFSDVLKGDLSAEEAVVAVQDGGFHLLPAGTSGHHPGWLLRGQRLDQLLSRYRQMFDLVIIDTPPVLPVPDALCLGRCADGAVLVVRYEMSRFPLVDRARQRILSEGIPILKTVVNGVRLPRFSHIFNQGYSSYYGYGSNSGGERTAGPSDPTGPHPPERRP